MLCPHCPKTSGGMGRPGCSTAAQLASGTQRLGCDWCLLVNALMRTGAIIELNILTRHTPQMALAKDEQAIQALLPNRTKPAFGRGVGVGCSKRRMDDVDTLILEDSVKGWPEFGVVVVDQELDS